MCKHFHHLLSIAKRAYQQNQIFLVRVLHTMSLSNISISVFSTRLAETQPSLYSVHAAFLLEEFWMQGGFLLMDFPRASVWLVQHLAFIMKLCAHFSVISQTHIIIKCKNNFPVHQLETELALGRQVKASTSSLALDSRMNRSHPCIKGDPLPRTSVLHYDCLKISKNLIGC